MTIYQRIKMCRERLNMTQEDLALKTGYKTRSAINKIEAGHRDINQSQVVVFARALGVSPAYLMGWEDDNKDAAREGTLNFTSENISGEEKELLETYRNFSEEGREKVLDYARDLKRTGLYIKNSENRVDKKK